MYNQRLRNLTLYVLKEYWFRYLLIQCLWGLYVIELTVNNENQLCNEFFLAAFKISLHLALGDLIIMCVGGFL